MRTLLERVDIRTNKQTIEAFNLSLKDILSKIHEYCAQRLVEQYKAYKFALVEAKEYTLLVHLIDAIRAYSRKLEILTLEEDVQKLYEENKLSSSLLDVELSRKDAVNGLNELKRIYLASKDNQEKNLIKGVYVNFIDSINNFIDLIIVAVNNTGHSKMLENKDFSKIEKDI